MISDETRPKVDKVREMMSIGVNIQATGEATNAIVTGMVQALLDHIDELEADLKAAIALGRAYAAVNVKHDALAKTIKGIAEFCSGDDTTLGALHRLASIRNMADAAISTHQQGTSRGR